MSARFGVLLLIIVLFFQLSSVKAQSTCAECHGEKEFTRTTDSGEEQSLYVDESLFANSVHGGFECIDCHVDAKGDPHPDSLAVVDCGQCHEDELAGYTEGIHGQKQNSGNTCAPPCYSCHGKHDILSSSDASSRTNPANLPTICGDCHNNYREPCIHKINIYKPAEKFDRGVHGHALAEGNLEAASCNSCHGSHLLLPKSDPRSPIFRTNISRTCGQCHDDIAKVYDTSSHGKALAEGEFDAPTCITCHGEHEILSPSNQVSPTNPEHIASQTCTPCHGMLKLNEKYGLLPNPTESYQQSYHGLASVGGSKVAANCTSCHGIHNILPPDDPESMIYPANLKNTCGSCHPNATEAFARSYVHASPLSLEDKIVDIIRSIYIVLIIGVIGGMILHNFIIWFSYVRKKYRALKSQDTIQRFDKHWVVQHVITFISFTILVVTGFALKFPDSTWVQTLSNIGLTEYLRGLIHRIAAVVLIVTAVYQWVFLFFMRRWKGELKSLLPTITDAREFICFMRYNLGLSKQKPEFDRYSYIEKLEFWALVWGNVVMLITGLVLWFPTYTTHLFPAWIVKTSEAVHYYEAWLAALAIFFYHMFFAIFHPEDYPINLTGFTGKITKEDAQERFPKWYKKVTKAQKHDNEKNNW